MLALSIPLALLFFVLLPIAYAMGARNVAQRLGRAVLPVFLLSVSFGLSALGGWRISSVTPNTVTYRPFETNPFWMVALYAAVLALAFLPTTLRVAKLDPLTAPPYGTRQAVREIPWFLMGLLIALIILTVLDIAGVPFIPLPSQTPPSAAV